MFKLYQSPMLLLLLASSFQVGEANAYSGFNFGHGILQEEKNTVSVEFQFADGKKKKIGDIPFKKGMTIMDVMSYAKKKKVVTFVHRGSKDTAFLTAIDGVKNLGAKGDNWIFRVNKKLGKKSFAITKLKVGDSVTWTFGKYKP